MVMNSSSRLYSGEELRALRAKLDEMIAAGKEMLERIAAALAENTQGTEHCARPPGMQAAD
jgi:hypothetical protein